MTEDIAVRLKDIKDLEFFHAFCCEHGITAVQALELLDRYKAMLAEYQMQNQGEAA